MQNRLLLLPAAHLDQRKWLCLPSAYFKSIINIYRTYIQFNLIKFAAAVDAIIQVERKLVLNSLSKLTKFYKLDIYATFAWQSFYK